MRPKGVSEGDVKKCVIFFAFCHPVKHENVSAQNVSVWEEVFILNTTTNETETLGYNLGYYTTEHDYHQATSKSLLSPMVQYFHVVFS